MALPIQVRPWFDDETLAITERWNEVQTEKQEFETEEDGLLHERLQPGYAQKRLRAAGEAVAAGRDPAAEPDHEARLRQIATAKRERQAGLDVLQEQYETAYRAARNEAVTELRPAYAELLGAMANSVIDLLGAAQAEAAFRTPLRMQDISFSGGLLQGLPLAGTQPDGSIVLWLRKVDLHYGELKIRQQAAKKGIEI